MKACTKSPGLQSWNSLFPITELSYCALSKEGKAITKVELRDCLSWVIKSGPYIMSRRSLYSHGHPQGSIMILAIDVVQIGLGVSQNAFTDTAVIACLHARFLVSGCHIICKRSKAVLIVIQVHLQSNFGRLGQGSPLAIPPCNPFI